MLHVPEHPAYDKASPLRSALPGPGVPECRLLGAGLNTAVQPALSGEWANDILQQVPSSVAELILPLFVKAGFLQLALEQRGVNCVD